MFIELDNLTGHTVFMDLFREHVMDDEFPDLSLTYAQLGLVERSGSIRLEPDAALCQIRYQIMNNDDQETSEQTFQGNASQPRSKATFP